MKHKILIFLLLTVFLLAACGSKETPEAEVLVDVATPTQVVPTETAVDLPTEPTPMEETEPVALTGVSECTIVSALPEPPQDTIEIFTVNEEDWVLGPENAAVTLIEYGDFQ